MKPKETQLWRKLKQYPLDTIDLLFPFYARLMRENNWSKPHSLQVIEEYKKFMFLWSVAGVPLCAPASIRKVWQLHLLYTQSYWDEFCRGIFGKPIHHSLTSGNEIDYQEETAGYHQLTKVYQRYFKNQPPATIWLSDAVIPEKQSLQDDQEEEIAIKYVGKEGRNGWDIVYYLYEMMPQSKGRWFIASFISLFVMLAQPKDLDYETGIAFIAVVLMIIGIAVMAIKADR